MKALVVCAMVASCGSPPKAPEHTSILTADQGGWERARTAAKEAWGETPKGAQVFAVWFDDAMPESMHLTRVRVRIDGALRGEASSTHDTRVHGLLFSGVLPPGGHVVEIEVTPYAPPIPYGYMRAYTWRTTTHVVVAPGAATLARGIAWMDVSHPTVALERRLFLDLAIREVTRD